MSRDRATNEDGIAARAVVTRRNTSRPGPRGARNRTAPRPALPPGPAAMRAQLPTAL